VGTLKPELQGDKIVVVVNAPELADPRGLARLGRVAHVISPPKRQGYGANLNLGVRALPSELDFFLLANDDVEFAGGCLGKLLETLDRDDELGLVGPAIQDPRGRPFPPWLRAPTARSLTLYQARLLPLGRLWSLFHQPPGSAPVVVAPGEPDVVIGAAMLVRAAAFHRLGGFDEDFFLYYEETDLCFRLREAGWGLATRSDAHVVHVGNASTEYRYWRAYLQSQRTYLIKRSGGARVLALQVGLLAIFLAGSVYHAVAAVARPGTARRRLELVKQIWNRRIFLLGRRVRP
jgi:GT2 family glycosyltransferase